MHRFFVPSDQISKDTITIIGSDVNHIKNVLRMKAGDEIEVFDGSGNVFTAKISEYPCPSGPLRREASRRANDRMTKIKCTISKKILSVTDSAINITLAQCLPKVKKMDFIVQKATELGVNSIIPVISERSVPKIEDKADKKVSHWQKIAKEAAEQSGRTKIPEVKQLLKFDALIKTAQDYSLALIPWEGEKENTLKNTLAVPFPPRIRVRGKLQRESILTLIGPEGGFSREEVSSAKESGFKTISLGKRILRCETAGIVALAQIFYELESN